MVDSTVSTVADPFQALRSARAAQVQALVERFAPLLRVADWDIEVVASSITELSGEGPESGHYTALAITTFDRGTKHAVIRFAADYNFEQSGTVNGPLEHVIRHELAHLALADLGFEDLIAPSDPHNAQMQLDVKERLCDRISLTVGDCLGK